MLRQNDKNISSYGGAKFKDKSTKRKRSRYADEHTVKKRCFVIENNAALLYNLA